MKLTDFQPPENMTNPDLGAWMNARLTRLHGRTEYPSIEILAIASHVLQKPKEWIVAHPETTLNEQQLEVLEKAYARLMNGEPLAYITGRRSFYGLDFMVDDRVLIPRPETELLVDLAIAWLKDNPGKNRIVDIGTGSGAIAVTLAYHLPNSKITAIDVSLNALEVARSNAALHRVADRIEFIRNDLLEGLEDKFDLVLANLPYIPTPDLDNLTDLKHEPRAALDGGLNGLQIIEQLITSTKKCIAQNGCMILEIQYNQGIIVREIALQQYPQAICSIHQDLAALPRVVKIQF